MRQESNYYKINRKHKKQSSIVPVLSTLALAGAVSLGIAWIWQNSDGWEHAFAADADSSSSQVQSAEQPPESEPQASMPEPEPETPAMIALRNGVVPESDRVNSTFFDDAVFIGDSLTDGILQYEVMTNTTVLAGKGINLDSIYTKEIIKQADGSRLPIMTSLGQKKYTKVYVMIGGNEVRDVEKDFYISRYGKLLDQIKELQPDATIYVQSILPVTSQNEYLMSNSRIEEYNLALQALCKEKAVFYVNVAECMKDAQGELLPEAAAPDGMHLSPQYYNKWFEYLKTHTV